MYKKIILLTPLVIALVFSAPQGMRDTIASMPTMQELMKFLGYSQADADKLLAGEIISRSSGLEAGSEKELTVTVGMLVRAPLSEMVEFGRSGKIFKVNREIIEFRDLGDTPPSKDAFAELGLEANEMDEVSKLLKVKPGSTFNLSTSEIERFKSIASRFKSKGSTKDPAVRGAVNTEYRAILIERLRAYREGGVGAIAPYDRGGKHVNPGAELIEKVKRGALMREKMPEFYRALLNYPRNSANNIQNQFFWIKQLVNKRPAFILGHRMYQFKPEEYALAAFRQFYVGHSYNSLHIVVGFLPVKDGTLVFYGNRTSTDQVAGFGGGIKRKIGSQMLRDAVVKQFTIIRQSVEKGGT